MVSEGCEVISTTQTPKNKSELITSLNKLYNPKIEVVEVNDDSSYRQSIKQLDTFKRRGNVSVVLIQG